MAPKVEPEAAQGSATRELCRYWAKGYCKRGSECFYLHPAQSGKVSMPAGTTADAKQNHLYKTELCAFYKKDGYCNKAPRCTYAHGTSELRTLHNKAVATPDLLKYATPPNVGATAASFMGVGTATAAVRADVPRPVPGAMSASRPPIILQAAPKRSEEVKQAVGSISEIEPPDWACCPITQEMFSAPVLVSDGFSYEYSAITEWMAEHKTSPLTMEVLDPNILIPNHTLNSAVTALHS